MNATINEYVYVTLIPKSDKSINIISADYKRTLWFDDVSKIEFDGDIDLIKAVVIRMQPDFGFELFLRSDIPPNTGLGSSGAVAVAIIRVFNHLRSENKLNKYEIAELAYEIESQDLNNLGGRQDQYASVFGGFNLIEFLGGPFVRVNPVAIRQDYIYELEKHLVLAFVGERGPSGVIQSLMMEQQVSGKGDVFHDKVKTLHELKKYCRQMYMKLERGELDEFGEMLDKAWAKKRKLSSRISTEYIDDVYEKAKNAGALGGKITGAGGGGCMILFCKSNKEHEVSKMLYEMNVRVIDFSFESDGLVTWELKKANRSQ